MTDLEGKIFAMVAEDAGELVVGTSTGYSVRLGEAFEAGIE
jgi:hypothetical protein